MISKPAPDNGSGVRFRRGHARFVFPKRRFEPRPTGNPTHRRKPRKSHQPATTSTNQYAPAQLTLPIPGRMLCRFSTIGADVDLECLLRLSIFEHATILCRDWLDGRRLVGAS